MFLPENLGYALSYIVGHPVGALEICRQPSGEWMRVDRYGRTGRCYEIDGQWVFEEAEPATSNGTQIPDYSPRVIKWPSGNTATLDVGLAATFNNVPFAPGADSGDGGPRVADSTGLYGVTWPLSGRLWKSSYRVGNCYRWDFGDVWSLDLPARGHGWREAEWTVSGLNKVSAAWMTSSNAGLYFEMLPREKKYLLQLKMSSVANDRVLSGLRLAVNGTDLPIVVSGLMVEAVAPAGVIKPGLNELNFKSEKALDHFGLPLMLDRVMIVPQSSPSLGDCND
jgi:hypothetical protein